MTSAASLHILFGELVAKEKSSLKQNGQHFRLGMGNGTKRNQLFRQFGRFSAIHLADSIGADAQPAEPTPCSPSRFAGEASLPRKKGSLSEVFNSFG
jgi:hypothetical protein